MAFQIIDDVLDYTSNTDVLGKKIGDDLRQGNTTLVIIYAISQLAGIEKKKVLDIIANKDESQLNFIKNLLHETRAIEYSMQIAESYIEKSQQALDIVPNNEYKSALLQLSNLVMARTC